MPTYKRARWGVRRTFQTEQAIDELPSSTTCSSSTSSPPAARASRRATCSPRWRSSAWSRDADKVSEPSAPARRLVEIARAVVGQPRLVLLDEPAAGLPEEETEHLGRVIRRIPEETGALTCWSTTT